MPLVSIYHVVTVVSLHPRGQGRALEVGLGIRCLHGRGSGRLCESVSFTCLVHLVNTPAGMVRPRVCVQDAR